MFKIDVKEIQDARHSIFKTRIGDFIEKAMVEQGVYTRFRDIATQKIVQYAREFPDSPYVLRVDGGDSFDLRGIQKARRSVWAQWADPLVELAFSIMVDELKRAIKESEKEMSPKFLLQDSITNYITVFHHRDDGTSSVTRGHAGNIKFRPGDTVMLIPDLLTALYANVNSKKGEPKKDKPKALYSSRAFMGRAADRIRKRAKISKIASPITLIAGRSRSAYHYVSQTHAVRKGGTRIAPMPKDAKPWMNSAWAIIIMYSKRKFRR